MSPGGNSIIGSHFGSGGVWGASFKAWGNLGRLWGGFGRLLGCFGDALGGFGDALGMLWEALGRLWEALGMPAARRRTKKQLYTKMLGVSKLPINQLCWPMLI